MKLPRGASGGPVMKAADPTARSAAVPGHHGTERALFPPFTHSHVALTPSGTDRERKSPAYAAHTRKTHPLLG